MQLVSVAEWVDAAAAEAPTIAATLPPYCEQHYRYMALILGALWSSLQSDCMWMVKWLG